MQVGELVGGEQAWILAQQARYLESEICGLLRFPLDVTLAHSLGPFGDRHAGASYSNRLFELNSLVGHGDRIELWLEAVLLIHQRRHGRQHVLGGFCQAIGCSGNRSG
ncbi:hypothetical protein D3C86_1862680 [compost metagenome]